MLRSKSRAGSLVAAALALLLSTTASGEQIERIIAIVNEEIITLTDVAKFTDQLKNGGLSDDLLIPDEQTRQEVLKDSQKLLQKMIDEKILDAEVKRQNLSVTIERVEQEIRSTAKRNNLSRDELKAALAERGVSFAQYQNFIKKGLERQALIEKAITSRIKVSEDDVTAAFATQQGPTADQAFEYTLAHVLFLNEKGGAEAAKARAENALKRLREGASFEKIASEFSEDPAFESGGLLGTFKTGELNKDLEAVVQKLGSGEFSGVIPASSGFQIVRVLRKRLIPDPRLEKEKEKVRAELYERASKKLFQTWIEQLRSEAFIRINPK